MKTISIIIIIIALSLLSLPVAMLYSQSIPDNNTVWKAPAINLTTDPFAEEIKYSGTRIIDLADSNKLKEYNGSAWVEVPGSTPGEMPNYSTCFMRPFLDNEIQDYPQVLVDGVPLVTQTRVFQRHLSNFVKQAFICTTFPMLDLNGKMVTFQNQLSAQDTAPTRDTLLAEFPDMDAKIAFAPDTNNVSGGSTKTFSARTALAALSNTMPLCSSTQRLPCVWAAGQEAVVVHLDDPVGKTQDIGWKQANAKTYARPSLSLTGISGCGTVNISSETTATNILTVNTATAHCLTAGDLVTITSGGVTNGNGTARRVASVVDSDTFTVSQSFATASQISTNLTLTGTGGAVGTVTPTRVTFTASNTPASAANHPLWPGDLVTIAGVTVCGITGDKTVAYIPGASTFQVDVTPSAACTLTSATAVLKRIDGTKPKLYVSNATNLTAPFELREQRISGGPPPISGSDHICSVSTQMTVAQMTTGAFGCPSYTISETSLTENDFQVTISGASSLITKYSNTGWAYARDRLWVLSDGGPEELVRILSVNGDTVIFANSSSARTYVGGTRKARSGTITLRSFGRGSFFSNPARVQEFVSDLDISASPNCYPTSFTEVSTTADEVYKGIRPFAVLYLYRRTAQYHVYVGAKIEDTQRFGDQYYNPTISVDLASPVQRYPKLAYESNLGRLHTAGTGWFRDYWGSGGNYTEANVDWNITYVRRTKNTYYYDPDKILSSTGLTQEMDAYNNLPGELKDLQGIGYYQSYMGYAGVRPELGHVTRIASRLAMCGSQQGCWKLERLAVRNQSHLAGFVVHWTEGSPDPALVSTSPSDVGAQTYYLGRQNCTALGNACDSLDVQRVAGLGRSFSIRSHVRTDVLSVLQNQQSSNIPVQTDQVPVRSAITSRIQKMETAHFGDNASVVYAFTGNPLILREGMAWAFWTKVEEARTTYHTRGPDDGSYGCCGYAEPRALARKLITTANIWNMIPDSWPEKTLLSQQIVEWIVAETDARDMTSIYSNQDGMRDLSVWAKQVKIGERATSAGGAQTASPLGQWLPDSNLTSGSLAEINNAIANKYTTAWEHSLLVFAIGRAQELGFIGAKDLKEFLGRWTVNVMNSPYKYLAASYFTPSSVKGWASTAAIDTDLNLSQSAHCLSPIGLTNSAFLKNGVPQVAGSWIQSIPAQACAMAGTDSSTYTVGGVTYYDQGFQTNFWRGGTLGVSGNSCDTQGGFSILLMASLTMLQGIPGWDVAWNDVSTNILNGSCAPSLRNNPTFAILPRPPEVAPPASFITSPAIWSPVCAAGSSSQPTLPFTVQVSYPPEVSGFTLTSTESWLTFSGGAGSTPSSATASIDCSSLTAGTYTAAINVTLAGVVPVTLPVTLTVNANVSVSLQQLAESGTLVIVGLRRSGTEACTISPSGASDVVVPAGTFYERVVISGLGLNAATATTVSCTNGAIWSGTLHTTTAGSGSPTDVIVSGWAPTGIFPNATKIAVEYSEDNSSWSGPVRATCTSGCAVTIPGTAGSLLYYRITWTDNSDVAVSPVGRTHVVVAK